MTQEDFEEEMLSLRIAGIERRMAHPDWPSHRSHISFPDGTTHISETTPIERIDLRLFGECKYCHNNHNNWWLMDQRDYTLSSKDARDTIIVLCGNCQYTLMAELSFTQEGVACIRSIMTKSENVPECDSAFRRKREMAIPSVDDKGESVNDLERKQLSGCAHLAKTLAKSRIPTYIIWEIGDAPYVIVGHEPDIQVCADPLSPLELFDIWESRSRKIIKSDVPFDEILAFLMSKAAINGRHNA